MNCPIDNAELLITERQGVEIDYCPKCRGVWLDRGELDKILDAASPHMPAVRQSDQQSRGNMSANTRGQGSHSRRRNKTTDFLSDLFDF